MSDNPKIGVIIATSMSRIEMLFSRSLYSVLKQTMQPDCVVVVDDNNDTAVSDEITKQIALIGNPTVYYVKNNHTQNMSGTGSWNTGVEFMSKKLGGESYIAILDDDDSWDETYLENVNRIIYKNPDNVAVFAFLKRSDCNCTSEFTINDLTVNKFLIGNPGVQGSNMCFKIRSFLETRGFDENLASCTDRDLMIRFLQKHGNSKISIISQKLINHFAGNNTVTSDFEKKKAGLDYFYRKHIELFDSQSLEQSLKRAENLFNYPARAEVERLFKKTHSVKNHTIAIGIAMHNNAPTIRRCLISVLEQKNSKRDIVLILADDNSTDDWYNEISDLLDDGRIISLKFSNNTVVKTRNMINDFIKAEIRNTVLIGRLDADDEYASEGVLSEIETIFDNENPDVILAGNYLRQNGQIIERKNFAYKKFEQEEYVLERLKQMSENIAEAELPSCNMFVKPEIMQPYPDIRSGEDHALLVHYLINQDKYKVYFAEKTFLTIYNLSGNTTSNNIKTEAHRLCREQLYHNTLKLCKARNANKKH